MRYGPEQLQRTRRRIVHAARRLFAERGYGATSIEAVMAAAGLTRGGFYRHFGSKGELYAAVTAVRSDATASRPMAATVPIEDRWRAWLSERPLALLAADACSAAPEVRAAAIGRFAALVDEIRVCVDASRGAQSPAAAASTALVIGSLALAQMQRDRAERERLLASCLRGIEDLTTTPAAARRTGDEHDCVYFCASPVQASVGALS